MTKAWVLVWLLLPACGRIGFAVVGDAWDAAGKDGTGDGPSADGPTVTSCVGLAATCGSGGTSPCCDSPVVTGGAFYRSYDNASDGMFPDMGYPATVSTFRLDTYEVTVGRFRQFVNAGLGTQANPPPAGAGARTLNGAANQGGWDPAWNGNLEPDTPTLVALVKCSPNRQTWTDAPGNNESLPMNCISWFEAFAFCAWDGGFLPTEAEWNYAAAGGSEQRPYPWSSSPTAVTIDCSYANYYDTTYCVNPPNGAANRVGSESPMGDGKWGQADLGGNLWEWTLDWYATPYPTTTCDDCANLTAATTRVVRSGSYLFTAPDLRSGFRYVGVMPNVHYDDTGVRCARSAP